MRPFKYVASTNNVTSAGFIGAGFNGIPVVSPSSIDVSGFDRIAPLTDQQACQIYWNLAGFNFNLDAEVPPVSVTYTVLDEDGNPESSNRNQVLTVVARLLMEIFFLDNDDPQYGPVGLGFQPDERMLAFPKGQLLNDGDSVDR